MDVNRMRDESYRKSAGKKSPRRNTENPREAGDVVDGLLKTGRGDAPGAGAERRQGAGGRQEGSAGASGSAAPGGSGGASKGGSGAEAAGSGAQKAARFLMVVGKDQAAEVLRHLDESHVEAVTREIARIGTVGRAEAEEILAEVGAAASEAHERHGGPAVAREFLSRAFGEERGDEVYARLGLEESERFAFLEELEPQQIVLLLKEESGPVVAAVLSTIRAATAARVLRLLPEDTRAEVVLRMARMDAVAPSVLERVEEVLKERIRQQGKLVSTTVDGQGVLASILRHMDASAERGLLESLEEEDPDLARAVRDRLFTMESVLGIADRDLQPILSEFTAREIACVLVGRSERVRAKVMRNVSERRARDVSEEYVHQADIPDKEVRRVQRRFLDYLRQAVEEGAVVVRDSEDEYI
ncbi:MAG: flagellar motor switch protein FliG [Spirochaetaceae bacterium]